jgi:hypothetical protein
VRNSIAHILLGTILLGSLIDLHDLAKVPRLIEHFQEHRKKSTDFSLADFFNLHYGSDAEKHDKEEHEKHTGLPFKAADCTFAHTLTVLPNFTVTESISVSHLSTFSNFYQSAFTSGFSQSIWQPPRFI